MTKESIEDLIKEARGKGQTHIVIFCNWDISQEVNYNADGFIPPNLPVDKIHLVYGFALGSCSGVSHLICPVSDPVFDENIINQVIFHSINLLMEGPIVFMPEKRLEVL